ncbi:uncharacterized protein LOC113209239 isoform X2 [Frankliniella occidentalis]|uniref:Uncharacterized protein LOC113209239 isoform X2 n=1 Tax=Frankliniella occidentalis TaxID=133901 RepID=A0A9C6X8Q0_FRAOC|nr:uncharacterized protein LOC113209239 isoform X2 [Frankliniella occidentalis]
MPFLLVPLILMCQGPYVTYGERFYTCEPDNRLLPWTLRLRGSHFNPQKPKEAQLITGNVTAVNETFDDSCWIKVILDLRSNNQWKENNFVFSFRRNACHALRSNIPKFYEHIFKKRADDKGACILKPGVYAVNNTPIDWSFPNVPIFPYGQYRFRMTFGRGEDLFACWVAETKCLPKPD